MVRLAAVRNANPTWFAQGNKEFFGDIEYRILHSKQHVPYLVRQTYAWSDMFGQNPVAHWRVNPIGPNMKIENLIDTEFSTLCDVKEWLNQF